MAGATDELLCVSIAKQPIIFSGGLRHTPLLCLRYMSETTSDFHQIVVNDIPLIDVRAPVEFDVGSFPNTVNLPLMNDEERHRVGICYKKYGQAEAIRLGHRLVSGEVKDARIAAWKRHLDTHPSVLIFCLRGGLRSQLSQQWACEASNRQILRLSGGFKAFRRYLLEQIETIAFVSAPIIVGGRTGVRKTHLLQTINNGVDLELLANHRGSAFGAYITPQPTQLNFENALAYALIKHRNAGHKHLVVEDEGRHVGSRYLPKSLAASFSQSDVVVLKAPFEERVRNTIDEYVVDAQTAFGQYFGEAGRNRWYETVRANIARIRKRLGGDREKRVSAALNMALAHQETTGETIKHRAWIEILLREYYDPMYDYQLKKKTNKRVFEGTHADVRKYLLAQG